MALPRAKLGENFFGVNPTATPDAAQNFDFSIAPAGGTPDLPPTAFPVTAPQIWTPPPQQTPSATSFYGVPTNFDRQLDYGPSLTGPVIGPDGNPVVPAPTQGTPTPDPTTNLPPDIFDPNNRAPSAPPIPQSPGQTPLPGGGSQGPLYNNRNAARDAWLGSGGRTVSDLKAFVAAHPEYGWTLGGSKGDKVYGPDGQYWADAVEAAGENGGRRGIWITDTGGSGGSGSSGDYNGAIDQALYALLNGGQTPYGNQVGQMLLDIILHGGHTPALDQQLIGARTDAARAQQSLLSDTDAALADRGMASTPGFSQGGSIAGTERVAERIAPEYAAAVRDIEAHGLDMAFANVQQALSLATGMSQSQASNILGAIGQGTQRQAALANIALQQLSLNQDWNKFLLQYGLDQQRLAEDIANGRMDRVIALLQLFLNGANNANNGHQ